jgi:hypothetical protein
MVAVQYKITNAFMFPLEVRHQQQPATDAALSKMEHELERIIRQFLLTRKDIQTFFNPKLINYLILELQVSIICSKIKCL